MKEQINEKVLNLAEYEDAENTYIASLYLPLRTDKALHTIVNSLIHEYKNSSAFKNIKENYDKNTIQELLEKLREHASGLQRQRDGRTYLYFISPKKEITSFTVNTEHEPILKVLKTPYVVPLSQYLNSKNKFLLLLIERERSRIFNFQNDRLILLDEQTEHVPKKVKRGSGNWMGFRSDPNEYRIDRHIRWHLNQFMKKIADNVFGLFNRGLNFEDYNYVILGTHEQLKSNIAEALHPYLKERIVGEFLVDIDEGIDSILKKARKAKQEFEKKHEKEIINRIENGIAQDGLVAIGPKDVEKHLKVGAVEDLVINHDLDQINDVQKNNFLRMAAKVSANVHEIKNYQNLFKEGIGAILRYRI